MTEDPTQWSSECISAAYDFGLRCASLASRSRTGSHNEAPLGFLMNALMTELWDRNFSQAEIREAFEWAIRDMPRYAAGRERRSPTSADLAMLDWRKK